jgi:HEAT repeat protein
MMIDRYRKCLKGAIMTRLIRMVALLLLASSSLLAAEPAAVAARPVPLGLEQAQWIWYTTDPKLPLNLFPEEVVYFRLPFDLPDKNAVQAAEVVVTADNLYTLYLNGHPVGENSLEPDAWNQPKRFAVGELLVSGRNILAVEAMNTAVGPAGMILSLTVQMKDGSTITVNSDGRWKTNNTADVNWRQDGFDATPWQNARLLGPFGISPWGRIAIPAVPGGDSSGTTEVVATATQDWPAGILFISDDCSLVRPGLGVPGHPSLDLTTFNVRNTRAFPEYDLPVPVKVGRKLYALAPAKPGTTPRLLLDAGTGAIGSPSVSFDGQWIYFSLAAAGDSFYHIYRLPAAGGQPQQLTRGPFHDIDPAELPDGRIVFTSSRCGTYDEYHGAPSRALFTMTAEGGNVQRLTPTFNFDNEAKVMADGRIIFVRSDTFFDRGKVETRLHVIRPDGTSGQTAFGLEIGPEYGGRLRAFNCGSPAPLPDGRVAFVTGHDIVVGKPGSASSAWQHLRVIAADLAPLPNGQLLATLPPRPFATTATPLAKPKARGYRYERIGILNPDGKGEILSVFESDGTQIHSPAYLGARPRPMILSTVVKDEDATAVQPTGILFCQNVRITKNTTAGWPHVRAVRVLGARGISVRSSHSYLVHIGSEVIELGTVPLAPDGSFSVEVPADMPIAFQAVDAEGRSELNEMSWNSVRPGERLGCVGCHQSRESSPLPSRSLATQTAPLKLLGLGNPHRFRGNNPAVTGLMELQFDRFREVAGLDRQSVAIPDLIKRLEGQDPDLAIAAAQRLAIFRTPVAAPALAQTLQQPSRELRVAAALALATCGTRASVPPLLQALADPDPLVVQATLLALENLTGHTEPAVNAFATKKRSTAWQEWFAATSWEQIEKDLVLSLSSPDRDSVRRAAVSLGHVGTSPEARLALRTLLAKEQKNNPCPQWRRTRNGDNAMFNSLDAVNPRCLQAIARAPGSLQDAEAVPLLAEILEQHSRPATGNLFLAEAAAEALGRIDTPAAETALINAFAKLESFVNYTSWYGDHGALMACHASPIHNFIIEALLAKGSTQAAGLIPKLIQSVPTDFDRALMLANDDYETLTGRLIVRNDPAGLVRETCLAILGDPQAKSTPAIAEAISRTPRAWGGNPTATIRAAQILSLLPLESQHEPRLQAAFRRGLEKPTTVKRLYDNGIPEIVELPEKQWTCFFLARALGNLGAKGSVETLIAALGETGTEAAGGRPDPLSYGAHFTHNEPSPCWRAASAWALGRIGDPRAVPALLKVIANLDYAPDTRCAAAEALAALATPAEVAAIRALAKDYPEMATRQALQRAGKSKK